ncbi:MAG: hypothetical protein ACFFG0_48260 [Candidatus Thorarchaeota archaeon]
MSNFFENIRDKVKNIPNLITKRLVHGFILGDSLEFMFPPNMKYRTIKQYFEDLILEINDIVVYDTSTYPFDYDIKLNDKIYPNKKILEIYDNSLKIGDKPGLIVPNRSNLKPGFHKVIISTHSAGVKASFNKYFSLAPKRKNKSADQLTKINLYIECKYCGKKSSDPNQVICESCGSVLRE